MVQRHCGCLDTSSAAKETRTMTLFSKEFIYNHSLEQYYLSPYSFYLLCLLLHLSLSCIFLILSNEHNRVGLYCIVAIHLYSAHRLWCLRCLAQEFSKHNVTIAFPLYVGAWGSSGVDTPSGCSLIRVIDHIWWYGECLSECLCVCDWKAVWELLGVTLLYVCLYIALEGNGIVYKEVGWRETGVVFEEAWSGVFREICVRRREWES